MLEHLVLASNNVKKSQEITALLAPYGIEVLAQSLFGVPEVAEPHASFVENALHKARHAARCLGMPALADDSGLCVPALGGAPGVHSARFAGEPCDDERNNALLLERMNAIEDRSASYYCVIVVLREADDPCPLIAEGQWHGEILEAPQGSNGFGYDPLFYVPELEQTAAQFAPELKNTLSHRAAAMRHLLERLRCWPA